MKLSAIVLFTPIITIVLFALCVLVRDAWRGDNEAKDFLLGAVVVFLIFSWLFGCLVLVDLGM